MRLLEHPNNAVPDLRGEPYSPPPTGGEALSWFREYRDHILKVVEEVSRTETVEHFDASFSGAVKNIRSGWARVAYANQDVNEFKFWTTMIADASAFASKQLLAPHKDHHIASYRCGNAAYRSLLARVAAGERQIAYEYFFSRFSYGPDLVPEPLPRKDHRTASYPIWRRSVTGFSSDEVARSCPLYDAGGKRIPREVVDAAVGPIKEKKGVVEFEQRFNSRYETMPSKFIAPYIVAEQFSNEVGYPVPGLTSHKKCTVTAGRETLWPAIMGLSDKDPVDRDRAFGKIEDVIPKVVDKIIHGLIRFPDATSVDHVKVNPKAHPGIWMDGLVGDRASAVEKLLPDLKQYHSKVRQVQCNNLAPWMIGGREKRNDKDYGEILKARPVYMPDSLSALIEGLYGEPLTKYFSCHSTPIKVGKSTTHGRWKEYSEKAERLPHCVVLDWTAWDVNVQFEIIASGLAMLFCLYGAPNEEKKNVLAFIASHLCFRRIVAPGGFVYKVWGGTPSGSPFTTLVNSVANYLLIESTIEMQKATATGGCWSESHDTEVSGDDVRILTAVAVPQRQLYSFAERTKSIFGMEIKPGDISYALSTSENPDLCGEFLGEVITTMGPARTSSKYFDLYFLPTSFKWAAPRSQCHMIIYWMSSPPNNFHSLVWRCEYTRYASRKYLPYDPGGMDDLEKTCFQLSTLVYNLPDTPGGPGRAPQWGSATVPVWKAVKGFRNRMARDKGRYSSWEGGYSAPGFLASIVLA